MNARVTYIDGEPDRIDDVIGQVESDVLPTLKDQDGFKGFTVLADRSSGRLIGISFWESEADVQASGGGSGYYRQRMADFAGLLVSPPTTTTHEVAVREP